MKLDTTKTKKNVMAQLTDAIRAINSNLILDHGLTGTLLRYLDSMTGLYDIDVVETDGEIEITMQDSKSQWKFELKAQKMYWDMSVKFVK